MTTTMKKIICYLFIISLLPLSLSAFSDSPINSLLLQKEPIDVIIKTPNGKVVANASVELFSIEGDFLWKAKTDLEGKATVWQPALSQIGWIQVKWKNIAFQLKMPMTANKGINTITLDVPCQQFAGKDMMVLLDATNSMKAEFATILSAVQSQNIPIMLARDIGERFLVQKIDTKGDVPSFAFQAAGGGSDEEAIDTILLAALKQHDWNEQAASRQLIYITDALPRLYNKEGNIMDKAIQYAANRGIKISTIACDGINVEGENSLNNITLLTGGSSTYLQNHPDTKQLSVVSTRGRTSLNEWLSINKNTDTAFNSCIMDEGYEKTVANTKTPSLLNCYPNPASTSTNIQLSEAIEQLNIYSSDGRLHYQLQDIKVSQLEIAVAEWPAGIYRIEVLNENGVSFKGQLSVVK